MTLAKRGLGAGGITSGIWGSEVDMGSSASSSRAPGICTASDASGVTTVMAGGDRGGERGGGSTSGGRCEEGELLEEALLEALWGSVSPDEEDDASVRLLIKTHESSTSRCDTRCGLYGGIGLPWCRLPRWLIANSTNSSFSVRAKFSDLNDWMRI